MPPRSPHEEHRAATPLELFFDLVFVVAVAQGATALHHAVAEGHAAEGVLNYALVFFAIWWAWMNFTWFASAYDTDDVPYRLLTFLQIGGALLLAAGVDDAFEGHWAVVTYGYVVMRVAMVMQWSRAALTDTAGRSAAIRYAVGISVMQVCWVLLLRVPATYLLPFFLACVALELLVPVWAERTAPTTWHAEHIMERFGLFTIIVLGESILAASIAIDAAAALQSGLTDLVPTIVGGLVVVCACWWVYFGRSMGDRLTTMPRVFAWSYGHYFVFGSGAAIGAGLAVWIDFATDHASIGRVEAGYALAVPVAVYLLSIWALHFRRSNTLVQHTVLPLAALLALATPYTREPVAAVATVVAGAMAFKLYSYWRGRRRARGPAAP